MDVGSRTSAGMALMNEGFNPTEEQLTVAFQAALKTLECLGEARSMVEVVKIYFTISPGIQTISSSCQPGDLSPCFEVILVDPHSKKKIEVVQKCAWQIGSLIATDEELAGLVVQEVYFALREAIQDFENCGKRFENLRDAIRLLDPTKRQRHAS